MFSASVLTDFSRGMLYGSLGSLNPKHWRWWTLVHPGRGKKRKRSGLSRRSRAVLRSKAQTQGAWEEGLGESGIQTSKRIIRWLNGRWGGRKTFPSVAGTTAADRTGLNGRLTKSLFSFFRPSNIPSKGIPQRASQQYRIKRGWPQLSHHRVQRVIWHQNTVVSKKTVRMAMPRRAGRLTRDRMQWGHGL